ncbi:DUF6470 family protein [Paenibacillus lemnae]|uniref:Uncharacterized protein n=1 Tax=Paenibacillus lemnae TaxID=1330551 RepID=A0A848M7K2_PAELE|nr:DUF6470 family protein [Paenibacillus lemnae]NMO96616.1 hypothetical protein [Paenibacillus lemnae]
MLAQPILQIRQTPGRIHIDADPGTFSIRQPKADISQRTEPAQWSIRYFRPEMRIDQSKAFAAYHGGNMIDMNSMIYSGIEQIFLQAIARRVEQGNRMAEFFKPGNTIAEVYGSDTKANSFPEFRGPASMDNVDITIQTRPPEISFQPAEVNLQVETHRPEIQYTRGKLDIYMKQYPAVQYTPPDLDTYM